MWDLSLIKTVSLYAMAIAKEYSREGWVKFLGKKMAEQSLT